MESMGVEWNYLNRGMSSNEEADFIANFLGNFRGPNEVDVVSSLGVPSSFWPGYGSTMKMVKVGEGSYHSSNVANNSNFYCFSQGSNYSDGISFLTSSDENYYLSDSHPILVANYSSISMDSCMENANNGSSYFIGGNDRLNHEVQESILYPKMNLQLKRDSKIPEKNNSSDKSKKRPRDSKEVQKNKRSTTKTRNQKLINEEESNANHIGQTSSSCSEDDSNVSHELNRGVSSSSKEPASVNLKTRASRGSATDPQSLYARKRRERINERLKILQNLVPNGTKVDISTMLDEAVQYVKFLQLQIKLLSSEDLWMYAPIAYNGKDIGLDLKISISRNS